MQNLKSLKNTIISTGGGCVLSDKNKSIIKNSGIVVWLKAEPETLHDRLNNLNCVSILFVNLSHTKILSKMTPITVLSIISF